MKNSSRGEIATILIIGTFVVLGISTLISTVFLKNKTPNTNSKAAGLNCTQYPIIPPEAGGTPNGYYWKADCNQWCATKDVCPQNTQQSQVYSPDSNWCYGFDNGARCMQLQYGTRPNEQPTAAPTAGPNATPTSVPNGQQGGVDASCNNIVEEVYFESSSNTCFVQAASSSNQVGCYVRANSSSTPQSCTYNPDRSKVINGKNYYAYTCSSATPSMQVAAINFVQCQANGQIDWTKARYWSTVANAPAPIAGLELSQGGSSNTGNSGSTNTGNTNNGGSSSNGSGGGQSSSGGQKTSGGGTTFTSCSQATASGCGVCVNAKINGNGTCGYIVNKTTGVAKCVDGSEAGPALCPVAGAFDWHWNYCASSDKTIYSNNLTCGTTPFTAPGAGAGTTTGNQCDNGDKAYYFEGTDNKCYHCSKYQSGNANLATDQNSCNATGSTGQAVNSTTKLNFHVTVNPKFLLELLKIIQPVANNVQSIDVLVWDKNNTLIGYTKPSVIDGIRELNNGFNFTNTGSSGETIDLSGHDLSDSHAILRISIADSKTKLQLGAESLHISNIVPNTVANYSISTKLTSKTTQTSGGSTGGGSVCKYNGYLKILPENLFALKASDNNNKVKIIDFGKTANDSINTILKANASNITNINNARSEIANFITQGILQGVGKGLIQLSSQIHPISIILSIGPLNFELPNPIAIMKDAVNGVAIEFLGTGIVGNAINAVVNGLVGGVVSILCVT